MHGLASKTKATYPARVSFGRHGCPVLSHLSAAGGTAKRRADWAFVSGVSPVSPNLKLIERIQKKKVGNGRKGISGGYAPGAETGGTDGTLRWWFVTGQQTETRQRGAQAPKLGGN